MSILDLLNIYSTFFETVAKAMKHTMHYNTTLATGWGKKYV